jgi:hypothetical protein
LVEDYLFGDTSDCRASGNKWDTAILLAFSNNRNSRFPRVERFGRLLNVAELLLIKLFLEHGARFHTNQSICVLLPQIIEDFGIALVSQPEVVVAQRFAMHCNDVRALFGDRRRLGTIREKTQGEQEQKQSAVTIAPHDERRIV